MLPEPTLLQKILEILGKKTGKNIKTRNGRTGQTTLSMMGKSGVGLGSRGYGSASFAECFDRLGEIASGSNPTTCASEGVTGHDMSQTSPRHCTLHNDICVRFTHTRRNRVEGNERAACAFAGSASPPPWGRWAHR